MKILIYLSNIPPQEKLKNIKHKILIKIVLTILMKILTKILMNINPNKLIPQNQYDYTLLSNCLQALCLKALYFKVFKALTNIKIKMMNFLCH